MKHPSHLVRVAYQAFVDLKRNDPLRLAAATAFFALFALPPIIIILGQLYSGLVSGPDQRLSGQLFAKLAQLLGTPSAQRLQDISQHLQQPRATPLLTTLSVFLLVLSSTTLFAVIKNSLNQLWQVRPVANRPIRFMFWEKALALGLILAGGVLFAASWALHQAVKSWQHHWVVYSVATSWSRPLFQQIESLVGLTVGVALLFKFLPDVRIGWPAVGVGALMTGGLLKVGEQVLQRLLVQSSVSSFFGSSGALMLILLFAFYSSLIFYYGASFTCCYALWRKQAPLPGAQAVAYQINDLEGRSSKEA